MEKLNKRTVGRYIRKILRLSKKSYRSQLRKYNRLLKNFPTKVIEKQTPGYFFYTKYKKFTSSQSFLFLIAREKEKTNKLGLRYKNPFYLYTKNLRKSRFNIKKHSLKKTLQKNSIHRNKITGGKIIDPYFGVDYQNLILFFYYPTILANGSAFNFYLNGYYGNISWRHIFNIFNLATEEYGKIVPESYNIGATSSDNLDDDDFIFHGDYTDDDEIDEEKDDFNFIPCYNPPFLNYTGASTLLNRHFFIMHYCDSIGYKIHNIYDRF